MVPEKNYNTPPTETKHKRHATNTDEELNSNTKRRHVISKNSLPETKNQRQAIQKTIEEKASLLKEAITNASVSNKKITYEEIKKIVGRSYENTLNIARTKYLDKKKIEHPDVESDAYALLTHYNKHKEEKAFDKLKNIERLDKESSQEHIKYTIGATTFNKISKLKNKKKITIEDVKEYLEKEILKDKIKNRSKYYHKELVALNKLKNSRKPTTEREIIEIITTTTFNKISKLKNKKKITIEDSINYLTYESLNKPNITDEELKQLVKIEIKTTSTTEHEVSKDKHNKEKTIYEIPQNKDASNKSSSTFSALQPEGDSSVESLTDRIKRETSLSRILLIEQPE